MVQTSLENYNPCPLLSLDHKTIFANSKSGACANDIQ